MSDDGILFIEVPNAEEYNVSSPYGFYWFMATKEHLNHFSIHHIEELFRNSLSSESNYKLVDSSKILRPYNNPKYTYPSLIAIFKKQKDCCLNQK